MQRNECYPADHFACVLQDNPVWYFNDLWMLG